MGLWWMDLNRKVGIKAFAKRVIPEQRRKEVRHFLDFTGNQWLREVMNRETERFVRSLNHSQFDTLEVGGDSWRKIDLHSYQSVDYPDYDICEKPLELEKWDILFLEQVLEHVLYPRRAIENAYKMLKPGGYCLVTTPFLVRFHEHPLD